MPVKTCFKCLRSLLLAEFYRHPQMADGHLNKCKDCTRKDVRLNRNKRIDHYRAYDRKRGSRQSAEDIRRYRQNNREKYLAHGMVSRELRAGRLTRQPCEVCGTTERIHAHHDDYSKPLEVRWLCAAHHHQHHKESA